MIQAQKPKNSPKTKRSGNGNALAIADPER
jgi:hypothetical protein